MESYSKLCKQVFLHNLEHLPLRLITDRPVDLTVPQIRAMRYTSDAPGGMFGHRVSDQRTPDDGHQILSHAISPSCHPNLHQMVSFGFSCGCPLRFEPRMTACIVGSQLGHPAINQADRG